MYSAGFINKLQSELSHSLLHLRVVSNAMLNISL